ncbi:MAG: folate-binding protein YgfZ [Planctomycetes bacterium]|nr:folate-binding protein YgfZ [Planctomycetota bacterium]
MSLDAVTSEILAMGPFAREQAPYGLVRVDGADAIDYLQRLCSQDIDGLEPGQLAPAAFLDAKGKVVVTCLAFRHDQTIWLELQAHQQPTLLELLDRYHFSERVTFAAANAGRCHEVVQAAGGKAGWRGEIAGDAVVVQCDRRGVNFVRRHGATVDAGAAQPLSDDLAECLRMAAGFVRVGVDTEPSTLALEADLDDHCSTTKGCYTGQEVVARIHTYGHTNRRLCFLQLNGGPPITAPATLLEPDEGVAVGRVMHAVQVPGRELRYGLGYLPPDFQAPGSRLIVAENGEAVVVW